MPVPKLVAHRGYPTQYPENTLVGYQAAMDAGALLLETDVQLTKDGVPVLFHDRDLQRLCNQSGSLHHYSLDELAPFSALDFDRFGYRYAGTPIPTLESFVGLLKRNPAVAAFVEIKRASIEHFGVGMAVSRIIRALRPAARQCVLISYSLPALLAARNYGWTNLGAVADDWADRKQSMLEQIRPQFFFCDHQSLPRWGKLKPPLNMRLAVFETSDPDTAFSLGDRGVQLVETDNIADMLASFREQRRRA